jgi:diguanylate cyclase (GGDEF)-like protein
VLVCAIRSPARRRAAPTEPPAILPAEGRGTADTIPGGVLQGPVLAKRADNPVEPVFVMLLVAVVATLALAAALTVRPLRARWRVRPVPARVPVMPEQSLNESVLLAAAPDASRDGVPVATYDRVVRLVSWILIVGIAAFVVLSRLWASTEGPILLILATAGILVLIVHDVLPRGAIRHDRFVIEGVLGLTLATFLVIMTGRELSPFFFLYPLIVASAALVVSLWVTSALAGLAAADYVIAVAIDRANVPLTAPGMALVAVNIVAMVILAFVASYIAREQRRSREAAIRLSTIDSLTGLFNRAFFFAAVDREIQRSTRSGRRFGLLMMDLDGLKAINDRYGHFQGDQVLKSVASVIRNGVRRIDTAARYGGDEFVILLPETEPTGAYVLAEKIRQGVADLDIAGPGEDVHTSLSIGAVAYPDDGLTADDLLISADRAMYVSKRQGKNRVAGHAAIGIGSEERD